MKESADSKFDIFERLNKGAQALKAQELRNCTYRGPYNALLNELADYEICQILFKTRNKRMIYQENILRFFALRSFMDYRASMKNYLNNYMLKFQNATSDQIENDKKEFLKTIKNVKTILGNDAFTQIDHNSRKLQNKLSGTFYDSIMVAFSKYDTQTLINNADRIKKAIDELKFNDGEYFDACYSATGSRARVKKRILLVMGAIEKAGVKITDVSKRAFDSSLKLPLAEKQNWVCPLCHNKILSLDDCEIDHIIPYSKGGSTSIDNAQLVHMQCNRHKSDSTDSIDINSMLESINRGMSHSLTDDVDWKGLKFTMYRFMGKERSCSNNYEFISYIFDDIKDSIPGKFDELADRGFSVNKRSRAYISHSKEGMHNPAVVCPGVYVERCLDNNRMIRLVKCVFKEFNLDPSTVTIFFTGDDDESLLTDVDEIN